MSELLPYECRSIFLPLQEQKQREEPANDYRVLDTRKNIIYLLTNQSNNEKILLLYSKKKIMENAIFGISVLMLE